VGNKLYTVVIPLFCPQLVSSRRSQPSPMAIGANAPQNKFKMGPRVVSIRPKGGRVQGSDADDMPLTSRSTSSDAGPLATSRSTSSDASGTGRISSGEYPVVTARSSNSDDAAVLSLNIKDDEAKEETLASPSTDATSTPPFAGRGGYKRSPMRKQQRTPNDSPSTGEDEKTNTSPWAFVCNGASVCKSFMMF
jgi:hypothetical protein